MEILKNTTVGRYAVSKYKFRPGDEIFSETPFAFGPKSGNNDFPFTLHTHSHLFNSHC